MAPTKKKNVGRKQVSDICALKKRARCPYPPPSKLKCRKGKCCPKKNKSRAPPKKSKRRCPKGRKPCCPKRHERRKSYCPKQRQLKRPQKSCNEDVGGTGIENDVEMDQGFWNVLALMKKKYPNVDAHEIRERAVSAWNDLPEQTKNELRNEDRSPSEYKIVSYWQSSSLKEL